MPFGTFYSTSVERYVGSADVSPDPGDYAASRAGAGNYDVSVNGGSTFLYVGQDFFEDFSGSDDYFWCGQGFVQFDISGIPAFATITFASIFYAPMDLTGALGEAELIAANRNFGGSVETSDWVDPDQLDELGAVASKLMTSTPAPMEQYVPMELVGTNLEDYIAANAGGTWETVWFSSATRDNIAPTTSDYIGIYGPTSDHPIKIYVEWIDPTQTATPDVATVTLSGVSVTATPTVVTTTPGTATVTLTGHSPTVAGSGTGTATPGIATVSLTGVSPSAAGSGTGTATTGTATVSLTGTDPTATLGTLTTSPGAATVTLTGVASSVAAAGSTTVTPDVGTITITGEDVTAGGYYLATVDVAIVTVSGIDSTATGSGTAAATPGTATVSLTGIDPSATGVSGSGTALWGRGIMTGGWM